MNNIFLKFHMVSSIESIVWSEMILSISEAWRFLVPQVVEFAHVYLKGLKMTVWSVERGSHYVPFSNRKIYVSWEALLYGLCEFAIFFRQRATALPSKPGSKTVGP